MKGAGILDRPEKSAAETPPLLVAPASSTQHLAGCSNLIAKNFTLKLARAIIAFDDVELAYGTASCAAGWQLDEPWGRQLCALDGVYRSERWGRFNTEL